MVYSPIQSGSITLSKQLNNKVANSFIYTRTECGGLCYGSLIIKDVTLRNLTQQARVPIFTFKNNGEDDIPTGSPIHAICWKNIYINNIKSTSNHAINLFPVYTANTNFHYPQNITISDCIDGEFVIIGGNFDGLLPYLHNSPSSEADSSNTHLSFSNIRVNKTLSIVDLSTEENQLFNFNITLNNIFGPDNTALPNIETAVGGIVSIINSQIEGMDFYSGGSINKYLSVSIHGGIINHNGVANSVPMNGVNNYVNVVCNGVKFIFDNTESIRSSILQAHLVGCLFYPRDDGYNCYLKITSDSSSTHGFYFEFINNKNEYYAVTGLDSSLQYIPFVFPEPGNSSAIFGQSVNGRIVRNLNGKNITISGVNNFRYIAIK